MTKEDSKLQRRNKRPEIAEELARVGVSLSNHEVVDRHGSANAEFIKGYRGIDAETGQVFSKSLRGIAKGKINPEYVDSNIKQQAGYAAEVAATSRDNAEAIVQGDRERTFRGDDLPQYGKNHQIVDRVKVLDGNIIEGSQSQMKFVGNRDHLFEKIANPDGEFSRYRGVKLELPSEQFDGARNACLRKAEELRYNASRAEEAGKLEVAQKLRERADNYDQLSNNLVDSGLTTEDAIFYRNHPKIATALDVGRISHRAGLQGAKYGAAIGGAISVLTNALAVAQDRMQLVDASKSIVSDTAKAGAIGYGTAFIGSAVKGGLQQSSSTALRALAKTNAPVLVMNVCISLGVSIKRYVNDDINETELMEEVVEKGAGMLTSSMFAALGQIAIPVPFIGAAVGGMIGYTLSSMFYQAALVAERQARESKSRYARIREIEAVARQEVENQRATLDEFMCREFPELLLETRQLFMIVDCHDGDMDSFAKATNRYAELLGAQLQFKSMAEFDEFMNGDEPLKL